MKRDCHPLVSIGVPVFNGEAGLARSLDSLLSQDYPNLEIVVSDNGSTDSTWHIAERYSRADGRVKAFRADRNRGAPWNFNRVFELSSGEYFAWAAHDDERDPSFVSACVEQFEREPRAVLCSGYAAVSIDPSDEILYVARCDSLVGLPDVVERYREALRRLPPTAIYGLYRSSALRKTRLFEPVIATDIAFVQELVMYGAIVQVPKVLFSYRARTTWNTIEQDAWMFLGTSGKPWWYVPFVMLFLNKCSRLVLADIPLHLKLRLGTVLVVDQMAEMGVKIMLKMVGAVCPRAQREQVGRLLYGRWLANPNLVVNNEELFFERVCKPQLGWWR